MHEVNNLTNKEEKKTDAIFLHMESRPLLNYWPVLNTLAQKSTFSTESADRIRLLFDKLPIHATDNIGIEVPLKEDVREADISLSIDPEVDSRVLKSVLFNIGSNENIIRTFENPVWQRIIEFVQLWDDPDSIFNSEIANMWLEFDTGSGNTSAFTPSVFLGLRSEIDKSISDERIEWWCSQPFEQLSGYTISMQMRKNLIRCIHLMPEDARITHLAAMVSRSPAQIRFLIDMKSLDIPDYLGALKYGGEHSRLRETVKRLNELNCGTVLALNIGEHGIGKKIGIECFCERHSLLTEKEKWTGILTWLHDKGACTRSSLDMMLSTTGTMEISPVMQSNTATNNSNAGVLNEPANIVWAINHIKVSITPEAPIEAKGYLFVATYIGNIN